MHSQSRFTWGFVAVPLALSGALWLTGCATELPDKLTTAEAQDILDSEACFDFDSALDDWADAVRADGSTAGYVEAYTNFAHSAGSNAVKAGKDSDVQGALQKFSMVAAATADALIATDDLTTQQGLEVDTSMNAVADACGQDTINFG
jgi:hypothetical protein